MNRAAWTALLGGAAVVGPAAVLAATPPVPAEAFVPPQQPMVLTRTLVGGGLQISPPLVITREELDEVASGIAGALDAVAAAREP